VKEILKTFRLCHKRFFASIKFQLFFVAGSFLLVRLPQGRRGVLSPNHVTPDFFDNLDLKDSEKLGVTFRIHSLLLENLKKVLKNYNILEKL